MIVQQGTWEVCKHADFRDCTIVRAGSRIGDLGQIGLFGKISSLRELDRHGRRDDRWDRDPWDHDDDRWGRDRWGRDPWARDPWRRDPWDRGSGWGPPPGRGNGQIIWDDDPPSHPGRLSDCQKRVYQGFVERYGHEARATFTGTSKDGTIWWDGEAWRYRCADGRVNIWR